MVSRKRNSPAWSLERSGSLIDLDLAAAAPPPSPKERATSALQVAEAALKANPDDQTLGSHRRRLTYSLARARKRLTTSMP